MQVVNPHFRRLCPGNYRLTKIIKMALKLAVNHGNLVLTSTLYVRSVSHVSNYVLQ